MVATKSLLENPKNCRQHSPEQVGKLAGLFTEFGFVGSLWADENMELISGHGRLLAAKMLNMTEVPVTVVSHLTKAQKRALALADNRIALESTWDNNKLALELAELAKLDDVELGTTAFTAQEIANLLASVGLGDDGQDVEPEPPRKEAAGAGLRRYVVEITCEDEFEQENIFNECESRGWKCHPIQK
jgi:ParB-like chromosome segregation protein Spo0J